ncbi:MAG: hypothetical protein Q8R32_02800 [bacterium]|nr:hypothetical protein [bacterium]
MEPSFTAIIFDWHGVLDLATYRGFSHFLSSITGRSPVDIRPVISPVERQYVLGQVSPGDFWAFLERTLALTAVQLGTVREYLLTVRKNEPLWAMLPEFAQRYTLAILSDCPADKLAVIRSTTDLTSFRVAHFSCEQGRSKEDAEFFTALAAALACPPGSCLYVDDAERHVVTAQGLGFRTCSFASPEDLTRSLEGSTAPADT